MLIMHFPHTEEPSTEFPYIFVIRVNIIPLYVAMLPVFHLCTEIYRQIPVCDTDEETFEKSYVMMGHSR